MDIATASLLDEGTAAAEAMTMFHRRADEEGAGRGRRVVFLVSDRCFPQTIDVLRGRAEPLGIRLEIGDPSDSFTDEQFDARVRSAAAVPGRPRRSRRICAP